MENNFKNKIIIFVIGLLLGAVIASGAFFVYTKATTCDNNNSQVQSNTGNQPSMPNGQNGQPPEMPNNNNSQSDSGSQNGSTSESNEA